MLIYLSIVGNNDDLAIILQTFTSTTLLPKGSNMEVILSLACHSLCNASSMSLFKAATCCTKNLSYITWSNVFRLVVPRGTYSYESSAVMTGCDCETLDFMHPVIPLYTGV